MNPIYRSVLMACAGSVAPALELPADNLLVALDARHGITTVSGLVSNWVDTQHGTTPTLGQTSAARRPLYVTSSAYFGGSATVSSDGATDSMRFAGLSVASGPRTFYFVVQHPDITLSDIYMWIDSQTGRLIFGVRSDDYAITDTTDRRWTGTNPSAFAGRITMAMSGSTARLWINDAVQTTIATGGEKGLGGTTNVFSSYLETTAHAQLELAALYIYNASHDSTQRQAVWDYISQEWGV